jgi:ABC-type sugar transport system, permease component
MKKYTIKTFIAEILMIVICIIFIIPVYYLVVSTFKTQNEIVNDPLKLPTALHWDNYARALSTMNFTRNISNSIIITIPAVILIVIFGSMAAYAIARRKNSNKFIKFLDSYFLLGFMIPLQTTMIPLFLIMRNFHLINTLYGLIFLHSNGCIFACFLYKGFIKAMPVDIEEAAKIDGASVYRTFWQIVFPLLKPITATLVVFNVMWIWNDFILTYLFISSTNKSTLIMQVYNGLGLYMNDWSVMMPSLVIALFPMVIFYLLMQKKIVGGIAVGSLKG